MARGKSSGKLRLAIVHIRRQRGMQGGDTSGILVNFSGKELCSRCKNVCALGELYMCECVHVSSLPGV